ncbi:MAG TPA: hypothetical protein VNO22_02085 [Planctomycetota bacterium]|jgi:hypothetical protein|nr:hypothetical protein [Planctomycetota bacterium]
MGQTTARRLFEDPVRFACLCASAALVFLPEVPFGLTLLAVAAAQLSALWIAVGGRAPGWSWRRGRAVQPVVWTSSLVADYAGLGASILVGALLLARHFGGEHVTPPLGLLAAAVALLPDVRPCRKLLDRDAAAAGRRLREGPFFRDPAAWAAILGAWAVAALDEASLRFVLASLGLLQFNAVLVFVDKYLPEIEARTGAALWFGRQGRRLWLCLAPLALVPVRLAAGGAAGFWGAGAIAAAVILPDAAAWLAEKIRAAIREWREVQAPEAPGLVPPAGA